MKPIMLLTILALSLSATAQAITGQASAAGLGDTDKSFLDALAAADVAGVELSKALIAKSPTPAVREFAQTMLDDQTANYQDLRNLCDEKGYAVAPQMDDHHLQILRTLQTTDSTSALDDAYIHAVSVDQSDMDAALERIGGNSNDSDIARFASDTLAIVKKHERTAQELASK